MIRIRLTDAEAHASNKPSSRPPTANSGTASRSSGWPTAAGPTRTSPPTWPSPHAPSSAGSTPTSKPGSPASGPARPGGRPGIPADWPTRSAAGSSTARPSRGWTGPTGPTLSWPTTRSMVRNGDYPWFTPTIAWSGPEPGRNAAEGNQRPHSVLRGGVLGGGRNPPVTRAPRWTGVLSPVGHGDPSAPCAPGATKKTRVVIIRAPIFRLLRWDRHALSLPHELCGPASRLSFLLPFGPTTPR